MHQPEHSKPNQTSAYNRWNGEFQNELSVVYTAQYYHPYNCILNDFGLRRPGLSLLNVNGNDLMLGGAPVLLRNYTSTQNS